MITKHKFIFNAGYWLGEGKIMLNVMEESMPYFTRWKVSPPDETGRIECIQEIQVSGMSDTMYNEFSLYDITDDTFAIELNNQSLGKVVGGGIQKEGKIAWEFRLQSLGFEGFEVYEMTDDPHPTYKMHAEYTTNDDFRTVIHGRIWKQSTISDKTFLDQIEP